MGIPRLLSRLQDAHAAPTKPLGRSPQAPHQTPHTLAMIDGPSFAHYILSTLENDAQRYPRASDTVLGPHITYAACTVEAIRWLRMLESHGFKIKAIFFDGALPPSKRPVRLQRLASYAHHLNVYKRVHDAALRSASGKPDDKSLAAVRRARMELAAPGFLVSAVLEALLVSEEFGGRVFVVPDEADRFCVAAARQVCHGESGDGGGEGVAIFGNDSDLCVFDSGARTRVVGLQGLVLRAAVEGGRAETVLEGTEVWPAKVAEGLGLDGEGLVELAWWMERDTRAPVKECRLRIGNAKGEREEEYAEFAAQYRLDTQMSVLESLQGDDEMRRRFARLDARIAELVQQVSCCDGETTGCAVEWDMFLPFLLEDPTRTSAWRVGAGLRRTAYEVLIASVGTPRAVIAEFKRAGERVSAAKLQAWDHEGLPDRLRVWRGKIRRYHESESSPERWDIIEETERWRSLVLRLLLDDFVQEGWALPSLEDLIAVVMGKSCREWRLVHLAAQYQACFYSLRILLQILQHTSDSLQGGSEHKEFEESMRELLEPLEGLPRIAKFFEPDHDVQGTSNERWLPVVEASLKAVDPEWAPPADVEGKGKKRKKRKRGMEGVPEARRPLGGRRESGRGPLAGNPFAALGAG